MFIKFFLTSSFIIFNVSNGSLKSRSIKILKNQFNAEKGKLKNSNIGSLFIFYLHISVYSEHPTVELYNH